MGKAQGPSPQKPSDSLQPEGETSLPSLDLVVAKVTDVGRARPHNEDFVDCHVPTDPQQMAHKGSIYLTADGMGGHQAGEVASKGAVELVIGQYYNDTSHDIGTSLVRAFRAANQQIYEWARADAAKAGMGTTLVAAVILGRKVYVASVGDSRVYLVNKQGIRQITEDHSWVEEQIKAGLLGRDEARRHPQRNVVTRALGSKPVVDVDLFEGTISEEDTLVLCTDGLTGLVEDREIAAIVAAHPPEEAARLLVAQANERGGTDNISVVIVHAQKPEEPVATVVSPKPKRKPLPANAMIWAMGGLAGILLAVLIALVVVIQPDNEPTPTALAQITTTTENTLAPAESPLPAADTASATEAATLAAAETSSPSSEPTSGLSATSPTATLRPTLLPATAAPPTPTPSRKPISASPTTRSTNTPNSTYPAPTLLTPEANSSLQGTKRFAWQYDGPELKADYAFDLRIWSKQHEWDKPRDQRRGAIVPTDKTEAMVELEGVPAILDYGGGEYYWTVVVVRVPRCYPQCSVQMVGEWGEERVFTYAPQGPPAEPGKIQP
jgi:serine/threonine protein phosphatase PrpC